MLLTRFLRLGFPGLAALLILTLGSAARADVETVATHAYMVDFETGKVLLSKQPDEPMHPASMSKLMTVYMLFEQLQDGNIKLDDTFEVSEKAWRMGGSKMFVEVGTRVTVRDLLRGIIVQSGNDACIVVAEALSGSVEAFAGEMNEKAAALGLTNSHFTNASGWPDPNHVMSARDLAMLAKVLIERFPEYYPIFAEKEFTYSEIRQGNRNPLLYKKIGADGLKTGHTEASGYGLVASAVRNDRRLILVLNGMESVNQRSSEAERLLLWGFREFENYPLFAAGEQVEEAEVWLGRQASVPLVLREPLTVTLRRAVRDEMTVKVLYEGPVPAPIAQGTEIATLRIEAPGIGPIERPLVAGTDVRELGFLGRMTSAVGHLLLGSAVQ